MVNGNGVNGATHDVPQSAALFGIGAGDKRPERTGAARVGTNPGQWSTDSFMSLTNS